MKKTFTLSIILAILFSTIYIKTYAQCTGTSIYMGYMDENFMYRGDTYTYNGMINGKCSFKQYGGARGEIKYNLSQNGQSGAWIIYFDDGNTVEQIFYSGINAGPMPPNKDLGDWRDANNDLVQLDGSGTSGVLPVKWESVTGFITTKNKAQINWKVQEQNVQNYTLQKSADAMNFVDAGILKSISNGTNEYRFTDEAGSADKIYYRIMQTDLDGRKSYSITIKLETSPMTEINVYPNPFTTSFTVRSAKKQSAKILNGAGANVMEISLLNGNNYVPAANLPKGIYLIKTNEGETFKLIKY